MRKLRHTEIKQPVGSDRGSKWQSQDSDAGSSVIGSFNSHLYYLINQSELVFVACNKNLNDRTGEQRLKVHILTDVTTELGK